MISKVSNSVVCCILVMIRYHDFNFDMISIRYFENIAIRYRYFNVCKSYTSTRTRHERSARQFALHQYQNVPV